MVGWGKGHKKTYSNFKMQKIFLAKLYVCGVPSSFFLTSIDDMEIPQSLKKRDTGTVLSFRFSIYRIVLKRRLMTDYKKDTSL